jgi:DNA-directed RNA polymerase specialized sigma24 family protein
MHEQPRWSPSATRREGARLQPGYPETEQVARPVPRPWLREYENAAERLDRLLADAKLISHLQWSGFQGADYERFAEELARYGLAVLRSWMFTGVIFERLKEKGYGPLPPLPDSGWDADDRDGLVHLTIALALRKFREQVLIPRRWDHTKGATLKTFFIGQCLMRFPNFYRSWHLEVTDRTQHRDLDEIDPDEMIDRMDVEHRAVQNDELARGLHQLPDHRTRQVLVLLAQGHQQNEIAERLGTTRKAVEGILSRHRKRLQRNGDSNERAS